MNSPFAVIPNLRSKQVDKALLREMETAHASPSNSRLAAHNQFCILSKKVVYFSGALPSYEAA